ncbi:hypothetical protein ACLB2K_041115 [Fragaria x ananassa]
MGLRLPQFMTSGDVEAQKDGQLYPNHMETPQLRWAFIRKVYSIVLFQLALTVAIAAVVVTVSDIPRFFRTGPGLGTLVVIIILTVARKIVLLAVILTATVFLALTLYTFWAVKRGADFSFMGPFLFAACIMLFTFALIQFIVPMGPWWKCTFAALGAILACAFIVYDTDNIIKRLSYDEYILGAISIYADIVLLFLSLLGFDF